MWLRDPFVVDTLMAGFGVAVISVAVFALYCLSFEARRPSAPQFIAVTACELRGARHD
jgi:hypothetical protein